MNASGRQSRQEEKAEITRQIEPRLCRRLSEGNSKAAAEEHVAVDEAWSTSGTPSTTTFKVSASAAQGPSPARTAFGSDNCAGAAFLDFAAVRNSPIEPGSVHGANANAAVTASIYGELNGLHSMHTKDSTGMGMGMSQKPGTNPSVHFKNFFQLHPGGNQGGNVLTDSCGLLRSRPSPATKA